MRQIKNKLELPVDDIVTTNANSYKVIKRLQDGLGNLTDVQICPKASKDYYLNSIKDVCLDIITALNCTPESLIQYQKNKTESSILTYLTSNPKTNPLKETFPSTPESIKSKQ